MADDNTNDRLSLAEAWRRLDEAIGGERRAATLGERRNYERVRRELLGGGDSNDEVSVEEWKDIALRSSATRDQLLGQVKGWRDLAASQAALIQALRSELAAKDALLATAKHCQAMVYEAAQKAVAPR